MQDEKSRNIVHYRWIDECLRNQTIIMHRDYLNLLPLPHKVPHVNFSKILQPEIQSNLGITDLQNGSIAFTLLQSEQDRYIFEGLAELYGIQNKFKE